MNDPYLLYWGGALSVLGFIGSLLAVPYLIIRLPADYFRHQRRHRLWQVHGRFGWLLVLAKNLIGYALIISGVAMLVLPGQGLLTILVGVMLSDFPGKFSIERRLVRSRRLLGAMNWIRRRARRPPLAAPD